MTQRVSASAVSQGSRTTITLKASPELAAWVREGVLDETYPENIRADLMELIEASKSKEVKEALTAIAEKSPSERLKRSARNLLETNFAAAKAPAPAPPPKKK